MLTLKYINENTAEVIARLAKRNIKAEDIIAQVIDLDRQRKETQVAADTCAGAIQHLIKRNRYALA